MVRLKDIASAAGVTAMTVSKALRNKPDVSEQTKSRIRELALQMGYVPDISAQGLRNHSTRLLGLVIPASTNPIMARIIYALEERASEMGYDLVLGHTLNRTEREDTVIRRLVARRVEGLFVSPVYRYEVEAAIYQHLAERHVPVVLLGHRAPFCEQFPAAETEDIAASQAATRHLIELGHRNIAFFGGPSFSPWAQERLEGYRRAHREAGLPVHDQWIYSAGATTEEGTATAMKFAQERCPVTAIQCAHDLAAIGAADFLLNQGVRIPGDLSLVGFGNILVSEYFRVPLTTIRQPKLRLGSVAMDMMIRLLKGETVRSQRLAAELVIRASSGPVPIGNQPLYTP
jgi:DNA-binding LacI/PurR family transcriptional regulator